MSETGYVRWRHILPAAKGCRAKGGGRKDKFRFAKEKVTAWVDIERELGHNISREDVLQEFIEIVLKEALKLKLTILEPVWSELSSSWSAFESI